MRLRFVLLGLALGTAWTNASANIPSQDQAGDLHGRDASPDPLPHKPWPFIGVPIDSSFRNRQKADPVTPQQIGRVELQRKDPSALSEENKRGMEVGSDTNGEGEPGFEIGSRDTDNVLDTRDSPMIPPRPGGWHKRSMAPSNDEMVAGDPPTVPPSWGNPRQPPPSGMGGGRKVSIDPSEDQMVAREFTA